MSQTGFYLYTYGPDCLVSDLTIAAFGTFVCTEVITAQALEPAPTYGLKNLGALAGLYSSGIDFPVEFPLVVNIVDDANGQSFSLSETTVAAGGTLVISGTGFDEDDVLTGILASDPVNLGTFTVTGSTFSHTLTVPSGLDPGNHTITLYSNGVAYGARTFVLLGDPVANLLPATGTDATTPVVLGASLLVLGLVLLRLRNARSDSGVVISRRR
jgi:LPXTG-motif cell wall-anchored protein